MPLINLKTDLKSLKFGKDKPEGGSSNEPFIVKEIPDERENGIFKDPDGGGKDVILRGGTLSITRSLKDVERLKNLFFKTPQGLIFTLKQNFLSRTSVKTVSSQGPAYGMAKVNQGVYLPLGLAAQSALGFIGTHTNMFGINPFSPGRKNPSFEDQLSNLGLIKYESAILVRSNEEFDSQNKGSLTNKDTIDTVIELRKNLITSKSDGATNIREYSGGPGAILGIGKTIIPFSDQRISRTGINNILNAGGDTQQYFLGKNIKPQSEYIEIINSINVGDLNIKDTEGTQYSFLNSKYYSLNPVGKTDYNNISGFVDDLTLIGSESEILFTISAGGGYTFTNTDARLLTESGSLNYSPSQEPVTPSKYKSINLEDFSFRGRQVPSKQPISKGFNNISNISNSTINIEGSNNLTSLEGPNVYKNTPSSSSISPDSLTSDEELIRQTGNGVATWTQTEINNVESSTLFNNSQQIQDFRTKIPQTLISPDKKVLSNFNADYHAKRVDTRTNIGDPGARKDVLNYTIGGPALDKINASGIYQQAEATHRGTKNDLVKFSMGYVQNNSSGNSSFMNFRAYLGEFQDAYSSDWGETQYVGRGDKFYNYKGFSRRFNISWKVVALSKAELIPMYKKLNFLASGCAPDYSSGGFMRGNLMRLTVGGYLFNQLGFISEITYTAPTTCTWEIGLSNEAGNDSSVKELPHMIEVSNFSFTPIQDFVPRIADPANQGETPYIALSNGENTNY